MSINLDGKPIEGCPLTIDVDPKTKFGADLLNLLDDIGNEHERYTLVPYTDLKSVGTFSTSTTLEALPLLDGAPP